ncbi:MAG: toprim domain-containing protein, partial [Candidatus Levyibacteriota bacterium]
GRVVVVEGYMDVVALAQHGVDYAVATLGTSTTPVHAQKLFRLADSVVFCFDGDAAGRKAAWRALENTLPVLADGKEARFLFLPDGEDPDDFIRSRGKGAFEQAIAAAQPLSEYLVSELAALHPPGTAEGRAALLAAARPLVGQITAPIMGALLRRRLAELTGLPGDQLTGLLGDSSPPADRAPRSLPPRQTPPRGPARRPPSLLRSLIQGVLLEPDLARRHALPQPGTDAPEAAALGALIAHCRDAQGELTTAGVIQHFTGSPHAEVFANALASAADHGLSAEQAETQVLAAAERWRQQEDRRGLTALLARPFADLTDGERESLTQGLKAHAKPGPA